MKHTCGKQGIGFKVLMMLVLALFLLSCAAGCGSGGKTDQAGMPAADNYDSLPVIPIKESLEEYRGQHDSIYRFLVTGNTQGAVWGTGIYTDDSNLGAAAVHAGFLEPDQMGALVVRILPGQQSYSGSQKNGVTSSDYGSWSGSFEIISAMLIRDEEPASAGREVATAPTEAAGESAGHSEEQPSSQETSSSENIFSDGYFTFDKSTGTIEKYEASAKDVVIPDKIDGIPVTTIGVFAFNKLSITSVIIPDSVTAINGHAFANNDLTSVTIPDSVTFIGNSAFLNNNLTSVTIPDGVTTIGPFAFSKNNLTSVTIPDGITEIASTVFEYNNLTSVIIPDGVTSIGKSAFANNNLTSVTIPDGITSIGDAAFARNNLTSVTIPDGVTSIGDGAFARNNLTSVTIPDSVTTIGSYAFSRNDLTSVTIPDGVMRIRRSAFQYNQLTAVEIPNSVTDISIYAFYNNNLTSVLIPDHTKVHHYAFDNNVVITKY